MTEGLLHVCGFHTCNNRFLWIFSQILRPALGDFSLLEFFYISIELLQPVDFVVVDGLAPGFFVGHVEHVLAPPGHAAGRRWFPGCPAAH